MVVLVLGIAAAFGVGIGLRAAERRTADQVMDRRTALAHAAVATETQRYVDIAQSLAAAAGAQEKLTAAEFAALTVPLIGMRLPGATGVGYVVPVADRAQDLADAQRRWRALGADGLSLAPAQGRQEHAFLVFRRSLDGQPGPVGLDLNQRPEPATALRQARSAWIVAVSDTYHLIRDSSLPPDQRKLSFLLAAPVFGLAPDGEGQGTFRGWVTLTLRAQDFIGRTLDAVSQDNLTASLYAVASDGRRVPIASLDGDRGDAPGTVHREATVKVAQQEWMLNVEATQDLLPRGIAYLDEAGFLALLGLSGLLAALVSALGNSRTRAERQVAEATVALRAKQHYVRAMLDTMDVIVVASDDSGRLTMVNLPALELHGCPADADLNEFAATALGHYYETDGVTPLPASRLPLQRALAEGEVHDVEFIVAPPGLPRRWLSAHGRALRADDGTSLGAVTAAHDITRLRESEAALRAAHADLAAANTDLERSNEELVAFAGLVSHDLKSPLAGINGYLDLLRELAEDGTLPPDATPFLDRIGAGVHRMRRLIDDLLAYATARNAAPEVAAVNLQALVDDVVAVHADRLRLRGGPGQLFPDIYVAPLLDVTADPMMVRQLLDNLIGNALKYVPPDRAARVDITAEPEQPGWIKVMVADRGIGIPAGQHEAIFDSFHRAHRGRYPGTGLGLAICHRIVTRHGGRIGARDNPGGGTQIWFTLPVATRPGARKVDTEPAAASSAPSSAANSAQSQAAAPNTPHPAAKDILELSAANARLPRNA